MERTPSIKSFFLRLSVPFTHAAGQHVDVRLTAPNGYVAMRSYSIASSPSSAGIIELAIETVVGFVEKPRGNITLPLDIRGTAFQRRVWAAVMKVPFAETTAFAAVAREIGAPRAVRAVGNACSQNPREFTIPCHRVLKSDGSYSGGSTWGDIRQSTIVRREAEWVATRSLPNSAARQGWRQRP